MAQGDANDSFVTIGAITGAHGVRGDVRVISFTQHPDDLFAYGPLHDREGVTVLEVKSYRPAKAHFVVTPTVTRSREAWEAMKGTQLCVRRSALPPADEDEFYHDDLVGLIAVDTAGSRLGRVKAVQNFGAGDLLEIAPERGKPVLVPFSETDVPVLDLDKRVLVIAAWDEWADTGP
ncbi:MAG: ribosome maturation factor RimM [Pseudomonadota bacterium]